MTPRLWRWRLGYATPLPRDAPRGLAEANIRASAGDRSYTRAANTPARTVVTKGQAQGGAPRTRWAKS